MNCRAVCGNPVCADKTRFIELAERNGFDAVLFLRPKGFGKTRFASMLSAYWGESGRFMILNFDFSGVKPGCRAEESFFQSVRNGLKAFFQKYPHPQMDRVLGGQYNDDAAELLERFFTTLGYPYRNRICLVIDGYERPAVDFSNADAEGSDSAVPVAGFVKNFYVQIKKAANGRGPVARVFMTGEAAISLDSVTTGFVGYRNISSMVMFAGMAGFDEGELRAVIGQTVEPGASPECEEILQRLKSLYGGYRFSANSKETLCNPAMCLDYLEYLRRNGAEPSEPFNTDVFFIDGIFARAEPGVAREVSCQALSGGVLTIGDGIEPVALNTASGALLDRRQVLSALFYTGCLTLSDTHDGLVIPNLAARAAFERYLQKRGD